MKIHFHLVPFLIIAAIFCSCKSQKELPYLQDLSDTTKLKLQLKYPEPLIQKQDLLSIVVYSEATDGGKTDAMYNFISSAPSSSSTAAQGFLVDNEGYILYPRIGQIKAEGLTKAQLGDEIEKKLENVLTKPTAVVKLLNFKITMLGEVGRPGPISIPSEKVTILEAVGLAGDVSVYGKKDDIVVLREVDGTVEHGKIDLTSKTLFESPYYFLKQNDVVLVNPNKNKARLSDQVFNQRLGIAFSLVNMIALLYNIFQN